MPRAMRQEHGVSLSLRLAAGLDAVQPEECDTVSIAGMGGQTIADILAAAPWCAQGQHLLLLQPMTMVYELRQWLWAHGYAIDARDAVPGGSAAVCGAVCPRRRGEEGAAAVAVRIFSPALLQADGA